LPQPTVIEIAEQFDRALQRRDTVALSKIIKVYGGLSQRLQDKIDALTLQIGQDLPTQGQVIRMERYRSLLRQVSEELADFTGYLKTEVRDIAQDGIAVGTQKARSIVAAQVGADSGVMAGFNALPTAAIEKLLGFLDPAGPLYARINMLAPSVADRVAKSIIEGVGLGYNPRKIAAGITRSLGVGLTDALRMTRTVQLYASREASRATYIANPDIVVSWVWMATLGDPRTCLSCLAMHGSLHPLSEKLNDHFSGRCTELPLVVGADNPIDQSGEAYFRQLSQSKQIEIMGQPRWDAWNKGKFSFGDLSKEHDNDIYGLMRSEATLTELLKKPA